MPARPGGSIGSPIKRRTEVHSRHHSDQHFSTSTSTSNERLRRASLKYQARRSDPRLSQVEIVPLLKQQQQQQQIKRPLVTKTPPLSGKPVRDSVGRSDIVETRLLIADQRPRQLLVAPAKDSFSAQLLTEVSEEDDIRRHHSRGRSSTRYPSFSGSAKPILLAILSREVEPQGRSRIWLTSHISSENRQDSPTVSLFNLEPLAVAKTSPAQTIDTSTAGDLVCKTESEVIAALPPPSKNPRPYSLYRPDLFSTFRGIAPAQTTITQATSHTVQTQVTVSITSPTPQKPSGRTSSETHSRINQPSSPTRAVHHRLRSPNASPSHDVPSSHILIARKYITALPSTSIHEPNPSEQLRRQTSIARLRTRPTPSPPGPHFSPTEPLTQWLNNLCTPNTVIPIIMAPPPPSELSGAKSDLRRPERGERDRYESPATLDDEGNDDMNDGEGVQKAKPTASEELGVMIDDMLSDLTGKFTAITSEIMAKMDDMGRRIDNLEASLQRDGEKVSDERGRGGQDD